MSTDSRSGENVVQRWSRRKLQTSTSASRADLELTPGDAPAPPPQPQPSPEESDRILTDADMPPVRELDHRSDVSPFFSPGVSEELRRLALRKVFHLPSFNVRDGLDDYDDDFTSFVALGNTMTADLRHRLEMEAKRRQEAELARSEADTESAPIRATEEGLPDNPCEPTSDEPGVESASKPELVEHAVRDEDTPSKSSQS